MLATGPETANAVTSYGPILVGIGGLLAGIIAAFGRKDKRADNLNTSLDTRTNTALKGLEAALDRSDKERQYWEDRSYGCEKELSQLKLENEKLEDELERSKLHKAVPKRPRKAQ